MVRRLFISRLLGLAVVLSSGCATRREVKPLGENVVKIPDDAARVQLRLRAGYALRLELPPSPEARYVWEITQSDPRFLRQLSALTPMPDGAGASVRFVALRRGRTYIRFHVVPQEKSRVADPAGRCEIVVDIE